MLQVKSLRASAFAAALGAMSASASAGEQAVPQHIVAAARNEVRDGKIVSIYLDRDITTAQVYRVVMDTSDWNRRLTIRGDGVVLNKQRVYAPRASPMRYARR